MTCSEFHVLGFSNSKNIHLPYKILNTVDQGQKMPWQKSEMSFLLYVMNEAYSIFKHYSLVEDFMLFCITSKNSYKIHWKVPSDITKRSLSLIQSTGYRREISTIPKLQNLEVLQQNVTCGLEMLSTISVFWDNCIWNPFSLFRMAWSYIIYSRLLRNQVYN